MTDSQRLDLGKLILRVTVGSLMLFHGVHKLISGHGHIAAMLRDAGLPEFLQYGVPFGEVVAPILLILGIIPRISAALIAFTMFVSIPLFYGAKMFTVGPYGGLTIELNLFFLLTSIVLVLIGSGKYSISKGNL